MAIDEYSLGLRFEAPVASCAFMEPTDFLYEYKGDIISQEAGAEEKLIGKFKVIFVDIENGLEAGLPVLETLDGTGATNEFSSLFSDDDEFSDAVQKICNYDFMASNILIIDRIEVLPSYRGQGVSEKVMRCLIKRFGHGAGLVALKAFPLQFEKGYLRWEGVEEWRREMGFDGLCKSADRAKRALKAHYKRLGFHPVPKTDLMIACMAHRFPWDAALPEQV